MVSKNRWKSLIMSSFLFIFLVPLIGLNLNAVYGLNGAVSAESISVQPLKNLEVGDIVVDSSWSWEHRFGPDSIDGVPYSGKGISMPVTWIVVAKDHYGKGSGITLLSEKIIGRHSFDNSKDRGHNSWGSNHWGDSGSTDATYGIRKFLNGSSYVYSEGYIGGYNGAPADPGDTNVYSVSFFNAFSEDFRAAIISSIIPCKANNNFNSPYKGKEYITIDKVFLPSAVELGLSDDERHSDEKVWPYFKGADNAMLLAGEVHGGPWWYWTRSPHVINAGRMQNVSTNGSLCFNGAHRNSGGVRPAINLSADFLISKAPNSKGYYEITHGFEQNDQHDETGSPETSEPPEDSEESAEELAFGDVNGDGVICVQDAIQILRHIVGLETLPDCAKKRAKVSSESTELSVLDAIEILRRIVGLT